MKAQMVKPDQLVHVAELLQGEIGHLDLNKDMVAILEGRCATIHGVIVGRPAVFVHEFTLTDPNRMLAEMLFSYATGVLRGMGKREIVFLVDKTNEQMQKFVESKGAWQEREGLIYRMEIE